MWSLFKAILVEMANRGEIKACSMSNTYGSLNIILGGEKYLLTIMKEENDDAD